MPTSEPLDILVIARDSEIPARLPGLFPERDVRVHREPGLARILDLFEEQTYDVVLLVSTAFSRSRIDNIELLEVVLEKCPVTPLVWLLEKGSIRAVRQQMKPGSYDYGRLPTDDEELRLLVSQALARRPELGTNQLLKEHASGLSADEIVGNSEPMMDLYRQIRQAAATDMPVLILGETGTGKDLVSRAIHRESARRDGIYAPVNMGAMPDDLVPSELFGYERGAFTGAHERRKGVFETAHGGTVFLDEIGTVDEKVQITLLRLIEEKRFYRLGGRRAVDSDVRLIAATNADLGDMVRKGRFREDLYYRLDVFRIQVPALRERRGDISLLTGAFLQRYNEVLGKRVRGLAPDCIRQLESYPWPGNVRELKNVIERALVVCEEAVIGIDHLPARFRTETRQLPAVSFRVGTSLDQVEREMILRTLSATDNNRKRAAELLGISRRTLYSRLRKHGIS